MHSISPCFELTRLLALLLVIASATPSALQPALASAAESSPSVPQSVESLFADFDPRKEPLDVRVVREWERGDIVYRYVTYHIGVFKNKPARMAAFYGFPKNARRSAGLLHLHGGGQRAFLHEVEFYARRGYPCLSINWGGREMEEALTGDPNTDWGAVDPTQNNVPGYFNLKPGEKYLDPVESPRNNNWYLLTLGARRGLTFLEQQPEVDPERLGVYGHSMGGNLTVYVAGSDRRVKAAAPSVGGSGFRTQPWPLLPLHRPQLPSGDTRLFDATLGFESYTPRITAPLLWLSSTNDFHGLMDDTYRTGALIPHANVRYAMTPHMNHRFTPEFAVTRPLWFDQHLSASFTFPKTPATRLVLDEPDHIPRLEMTPDGSHDIAQVQIFYSVDPDPRARFWRSAATKLVDVKTSDVKPTESKPTEVNPTDVKLARWVGALPILRIDQPLFAFANVTYRLKSSSSEPYAKATEQFAVSSLMHTVTPAQLAAANAVATDRPERLIADFAQGWRDWYTLSAENPHHWEYSTRKLADPKWQGQSGQRLAVTVSATKSNTLVVVLTENFFRSYRGKQREFVAVAKLAGGPDTQTVVFASEDFKTVEGESLSGWSNVDLLSFRAYYDKGGSLIGSKAWVGPQPIFKQLEWRASAN